MTSAPFSDWAFRDANTWKAFMGITEDNQDEYLTAASFSMAPADEAWVYACVRRKFLSAQSVPLRVYTKDGKKLIPAEDSEDRQFRGAAQELQFLLDDVNPVDMNGSDLKAYTVAGLNVWGGSYWKKVRGRLLGDVQELYHLRVPDVQVDSLDGRRVDRYKYQSVRGSLETIRPQDMVAFRTVNLSNPLEPLSPLRSVRHDLAVGKYAPLWTASTLKNWGIPAGAWVMGKDIDYAPNDKSLIQRALRQLRGPKNAGKSAVLPPGMDWKQMAINPKDAEWLDARKASRMAVCAVLGVPLPLAGDDEKQSVYAAMRDAERVFWRNTMIPELDWYADVINGWLVPDFDTTPRPKPRTIVVGWDYSQIEAIEPTWADKATAYIQFKDKRIATPNEVRRALNIGDDIEGGDEVDEKPEPPAPFGMQPPGPGKPAEPKEPKPEPKKPAEAMRSIKGLYRHPAVKAFLAGDPLDADALIGSTTEPTRLAIEDGLRRRHSAEQIASALEANYA